MSASTEPEAAVEQGFDIYGVRIVVAASNGVDLERVVSLLPSGLRPCDPKSADGRFALVSSGDDAWHFAGPGLRSGVFPDVALPLSMLDTALRSFVVERVKDKIFVHAGAVAHRGRAILIPGGSFSGKSTLVAALVRAGAEYYSDEHAVLDAQGLVHPYARPLAIRGDDPHLPGRRSAESLGGSTGTDPVPVGVIVTTTYRPGARFDPERGSPGQGVLALLEHTHARTPEVLATIRQAAADALVVHGDRGDADEAASVLLQLAGEAAVNGASSPAR
jgi:hypothetical protein